MILATAGTERGLVIAADGPGLLALLRAYLPVELVGGGAVGLAGQVRIKGGAITAATAD
ncbi:hypothetical protein D3C85_663710 [compost metagenome]